MSLEISNIGYVRKEISAVLQNYENFTLSSNFVRLSLYIIYTEMTTGYYWFEVHFHICNRSLNIHYTELF